MRLAYSPADIARLEAPVVAAVEAAQGPDALMKEAAWAISHTVLRALQGKLPGFSHSSLHPSPYPPPPAKRARVRGVPILVFVGPGNNGGDGLYAGANLARRGAAVTALLVSGRVHRRGLEAARQAGVQVLELGQLPRGSRLPQRAGDCVHSDNIPAPTELAASLSEFLAPGGRGRFSVWIDALLGIGATGAARSPLAEVLAGLQNFLAATKSDTAPETAATPWRGGEAEVWLEGEGTLGGTYPAPWPAREVVYFGPTRPLRVAVDGPSGVDLEAGALPGPYFPADITVTMGAAKTGLVTPFSGPAAGDLIVHPLPLPWAQAQPRLLQWQVADARAFLPSPQVSDYKHSRGQVLVWAGTKQYPGAALLAVGGAWASGCGMVHYVGPKSLCRAVVAAYPRTVVHPLPTGQEAWTQGTAGAAGEVFFARLLSQVDAFVAGPGLGPARLEAQPTVGQLAAGQPAQGRLGAPGGGAPGSAKTWARLVAFARAVARVRAARAHLGGVLDAGALPLLTAGLDLGPAREQLVATPHSGEAAALSARPLHDDLRQRRWQVAQQLAQNTGVTVLLKENRSLIATPGENLPVLVTEAGNPALARAGSGDTLAGLLGGIMALNRTLSLGQPQARPSGTPEIPLPAALAASAATLCNFLAPAAALPFQ